MIASEVRREYFDWLYDIVCRNRFADSISYRQLFNRLNKTAFTWHLPKDRNRAADGKALRHRFAMAIGYEELDYYLDGPCSILEMMIALALRMEEDIMDDPAKGNRTAQWFWQMINNLGLGSMTDSRYDDEEVDRVINKLIDRYYDRDGLGGLFRVRGCERDLRKVEIWIQMLWYLDTIT